MARLDSRLRVRARNARRIAGAILTCWSLVHGLTLLMVDGLVGPKEKSDKLCESLVQGIIDGLRGELPGTAARHMGRPAARHGGRGAVGQDRSGKPFSAALNPPLPRNLTLHVAHAGRKREPDATARERTVFRKIVQDDASLRPHMKP